MAFRNAVAATASIAGCYGNGKSALGANSAKVHEADSRRLNGSVDLDSCLKHARPRENRWDYILGYNEQAFFIEVHPAQTSEVQTMLNKLTWLRNWLATEGNALDGVKSSDPFHWVFTNRNAIMRGSTYERRLLKAGLGMPKRELVLR